MNSLWDIFGSGDGSSQPQAGLLGDPDAGLMIASRLLAARRGEGLASLGQGLADATTVHRQNQQNERANRASDLQQLQGTYSMLKQQEFQRMLAAKNAGQPYVPNPMLGQIEQKMATLVGSPALTHSTNASNDPNAYGASSAARAPSASSPAPLSAAQASQYSPAVRPEFQAQGSMPQPQQAPQSNGIGAPAGGIPVEAWLATDPSGKAYMEQLAKDYTERRKPVVNRGFGLGVVDENGKYVPDQASLDQALAMKRGELNITEPFQTLNVRDASGAEHPQFKYQLPGYPGAQPGASPAVPPSSPPNGLADRVARLTVTQPSANVARDGQQADPWTTMPKRIIPQGMGQTTFDAAMAKNQADTATELVKKYGGQADAANQRIAGNTQALDMVSRADTGWQAAKIGAVKNALVTLGIPETSFANTPSADAVLQKELVGAAMAKGKQMFPRYTQGEVQLMLTKASPGTDMPTAAIKFLLNSDSAMAKYGIQQSADLGRYLQQGGDPHRFEGWYSQTFPATNAVSGLHLDAGSRNLPANVVRLPNGKTATFPSEMAATAYKKQMGL